MDKSQAVISSTLTGASPPPGSPSHIPTSSTNPAPHGTTNISQYFDGKKHWFKLMLYRNPQYDPEKHGSLTDAPLYFHRDILDRQTYRAKDLLRYISPTYGKPYRMLVQAASNAYNIPADDWRRRRVSGNAPWLLLVANWVAKHEISHAGDYFVKFGKAIISVPAIFFLISFPIGGKSVASFTYKEFPGRCYEYPKHAINQLDASPLATNFVYGTGTNEGIKFETNREQMRMLRPRQLCVFSENQWMIVDGEKWKGTYIFISYAAMYYNSDEDMDRLEDRARDLAKEFKTNAYWLDTRCRATQQPELSDDVHRFCDVTRGAEHVCIMLPEHEDPDEALIKWGERMWCFPEALLARDHKVMIFGRNGRERVDIMDLVYRSWAIDTRPSDTTEEHRRKQSAVEQDFRLLVEHFTGSLTLTRLQLVEVALRVLRSRQWKEFQQGDIAYALMTILPNRPAMDPTDTELQALARLSLSNDSDRIIERMICMQNARIPGVKCWFGTGDALHASLWDIEPLCQVAGVCHDGSIILDGCHAISIRWKNFPAIYFTNRGTWKKLWATMILRSGPYWFIAGLATLMYGAIGVLLIVIGILLLLGAPWSIVALYGGKVWGATPWLVGFEGTMDIKTIEKMMFGNCIGRLEYAPSSSILCAKRGDERIGAEPHINPASLPEGERVFTLVDTGTRTVTVFSARKPPSVALICGKEGGMLRVLLCSYERSTNSLQKECVVRMETPMWDQSLLHGWVKLS